MPKYVIARQLSGKRLITNEGEDFGRIVDLEINELSGKLELLVVEPNPDSSTAGKMRSGESGLNVPYESVLAVGDFVIVDKRNMLG